MSARIAVEWIEGVGGPWAQADLGRFGPVARPSCSELPRPLTFAGEEKSREEIRRWLNRAQTGRVREGWKKVGNESGRAQG